LVQLTKLDNPPSKQLSAEEIAIIWNKVPKDKMIQFKLKVDLSPDVLSKISVGGDGVPIPEQDIVKQKQSDIFNSVKGNVADKMLKDDRAEETKETTQQRPPKINKGFMEDIKEQDSEQESQRNSVPPMKAPAP
jgi:hypothetical protein